MKDSSIIIVINNRISSSLNKITWQQVKKQFFPIYMRVYWAKLAKIANCWRAAKAAKKMGTAWKELFPNGWQEAPKRVPPRPLRGRWGNASSVEQHILLCGQPMLPVVFKHAFAVKARKRAPRRGAVVEDEELGMGCIDEEDGMFSERMNRWQTEASSALDSNDWWVQLHIAHTVRGPSDHLVPSYVFLRNSLPS